MITKYVSKSDFFVLLLTLIFFILALFTEGIIHDLSLEIGILLVSVKLIMFNYHSSKDTARIIEKLEKIEKDLQEHDNKKSDY